MAREDVTPLPAPRNTPTPGRWTERGVPYRRTFRFTRRSGPGRQLAGGGLFVRRLLTWRRVSYGAEGLTPDGVKPYREVMAALGETDQRLAGLLTAHADAKGRNADMDKGVADLLRGCRS